MKLRIMIKLFLAIIAAVGFLAYTAVPEGVASDVDELLSKPKAYVGSENCKGCHLPQYYSWRTTMHSRMAQDARVNKDAIIVELDEKRIRKDLAKRKLKVPADQIYVPTPEEIKYTIGSKWKQRFIVEKNGTLFISPVQYNADTDKFVNYHEADWDKRPWLLKCGGCHTTGVDLEKQKFIEPAVGCEACHGPGSWHYASPTTEFYKNQPAIINPAKLTKGVAVQVCGSCHNRGKATKHKGAGWPVGYKPGRALGSYYKETSYAAGDKKHMYPNEYSKGHHQQYIDWKKSVHKKEGVTCTACHSTHAHELEKSKLWQAGGAQPEGGTWHSTPANTWADSGDKQCLNCHVQVNKTAVHSIHTFGKCVGCHMPRIAKSAESGDIHSHVFTALLPEDTIANPEIPNSCQACHKHKDEDVNKLNEDLKKIQAAMLLGG
ncbi:MAG TPA: hypothetical protein ENI07_07790 [Desulfobacterales bacterium]|nr:hypothetical protein [Desulfobacterales bacterium]